MRGSRSLTAAGSVKAKLLHHLLAPGSRSTSSPSRDDAALEPPPFVHDDDDVLLENQRDEGRHVVLAGFTLAGDHLVMDASSSS
jgi:hypothetical protein